MVDIKQLSQRQQDIYNAVKTHGPLSRIEVAKIVNITPNNATHYLGRLRVRGILKVQDSGVNAQWSLIETKNKANMETTIRMSPRQRQIYELIKTCGPLKRADVAASIGISPITAGVHLQTMRAIGALYTSSLGRYAVWSLAPVNGQSKTAETHALDALQNVWRRAA